MPKIIDTKITDRINYNNPKGFRGKRRYDGATIQQWERDYTSLSKETGFDMPAYYTSDRTSRASRGYCSDLTPNGWNALTFPDCVPQWQLDDYYDYDNGTGFCCSPGVGGDAEDCSNTTWSVNYDPWSWSYGSSWPFNQSPCGSVAPCGYDTYADVDLMLQVGYCKYDCNKFEYPTSQYFGTNDCCGESTCPSGCSSEFACNSSQAARISCGGNAQSICCVCGGGICSDGTYPDAHEGGDCAASLFPPICAESGYFCTHEGGYMDGAGTPHSDCGSCVEFSQDATNCEGHCGEFTLCYWSSSGSDPNDIPVNSNCECASLPAPDCNWGNYTGGWSCDTECVKLGYGDCAQPSFCQYCDYLDGWENASGDMQYECQDNGAPIYMCDGSWNPGDTCDFYGMSVFQGFCDCSGFCRWDPFGDQGWGLIDNGCCENCQTVECRAGCPGGGPHADLISCNHWDQDEWDCTHMNCNQLLYEIQNDASGWDNSEWFAYMDLHCGQNISDYVDHYMNLENGYKKAKTAWFDFIESGLLDVTSNLEETVEGIYAELEIIKNKKDAIRTYFLQQRENAFNNSTIKDLIQEIEEVVNNIRNTTVVVTLTWHNQYLKPWNEGINMMDDAIINLKQFEFTSMAQGCFNHLSKLFKCGIDQLNDLLSDTKNLIAEWIDGCGNPNEGNVEDHPCDAYWGTILGQDVIMLLDETYTVVEELPFNCGEMDVAIKFGISSVQTGDVSVTWDTGATSYEEWKAGTPFKFIITMDGIRIYSPLKITIEACGTPFAIDLGHLWFGSAGPVNSRPTWWDPSGDIQEWLSLVIFQFDVSAITDDGVLTGIGIDMPIDAGWSMLGNSGNMGIQNPYINFIDEYIGFACADCGYVNPSGDECVDGYPGTCAPFWPPWETLPCHAMTAICFTLWLIKEAVKAQLNLFEILVNIAGKFFMNNIMNSMYKKLLQNGYMAIGEVLDPEEAQDSAVDSFNKKMAQLLGVVGCEWENMKVVWGYFLNILDSAKIIQSLDYLTWQRDIADDAISTFKDGLNDGPKNSLKHIKLNEPTLWEGWVDDAINQTQVLIDDFEGTLLTITGLSPANQDIIDEELSLINEYLDDIENFDWYEDMETEWCDGSSGGYCSYTSCEPYDNLPISNCGVVNGSCGEYCPGAHNTSHKPGCTDYCNNHYACAHRDCESGCEEYEYNCVYQPYDTNCNGCDADYNWDCSGDPLSYEDEDASLLGEAYVPGVIPPIKDPQKNVGQFKKGGRLKRGKHRTKPVGRGM